MATVAGIKIKVKPKTVRNPLFFDEKYTGPEPTWDTQKALQMTQEEFDHHLRGSFYYYNYYYTQKDLKKHLVEWMQENGYSKNQVSNIVRSPDRALPMTVYSLLMAHLKGMPFREKEFMFFKTTLDQVANSDVADEVSEPDAKIKKTEPHRPSIQDRLNEKTQEIIGEIEGHYDQLILGKKVDFKPYDFLTANKVPQSQLGKYEEIFIERRQELEQAQSKKDAQLVEGYRHYKSSDYKRIFAWIDELLSSIEQYRGVKKASKKAKVRKAPSKEKLVSKLKYAKEDKALKIVSINPADIIGATELWVYNASTRKLGKYVSAPYQTLSVKGTSILNYDETKSVSKTLRKPDEQLKEFAKAGKVALRTFLKDIKAVEIKLNGRINQDILLLKTS